MRIAYLSTDYPAVSHTFIQREIHALEARGIEVVPMTLNRAPDGQLLTDRDCADAARTFVVKSASPGTALALATTMARHPVATLRGLRRAFVGTRDPTRIGKQLLQFFEALLVWRHCRTEHCDAIHAHFGQAPASVAWFAASFANDVGRRSRRRRFTWSVTIHGWHEFVTEDTSRLSAKIEAADGIVCISQYTRSQLMRIGPVAAWPKIDIVRCGLDLDDFAFRGTRSTAEAPTVVVTARLSPEKGHLVLVQALAQLRADGLDVRARFIGAGPFEPELCAAATGAGVADLVEFVGMLSPTEVTAALRGADVFCLPSFAEGLPVSIMEAMAVGVPVVATYISGIPELVVNDLTGWVVPAGDVDALAGAVRSALESPTRDEIVLAAREAVAEAHDIRRNVIGLEAALRRAHHLN